ncbi:hypothetical protein [Tenacibaculum finnmarkense]|uniref:hypothetical protein n=1 Tax=Tenacibaculum finnmarkense TaxID=2781243 RepID=UPI00187B544A|nr:hypothetical protein [Tenacibaculum finnmarkense]MBE7649249.1 hypothetical protein [Tenacibaculum finnmarkense genomovar ulcerans]
MFNKKLKKPLHKTLTSMRSLAISIQSYNIFYGIKFASFFYLLAISFIPNDYVRVLSAVFFGFFTSKTMKDIGIHIEKGKEWVIVSLAVFDFLMLCVIFDVFHKKDSIDILNSLIFCLFVPYLGYWLNHVFVLKVKENEAKEQEEYLTIDQQRASLKEEIEILNIAKLDFELNKKEIEIFDQKSSDLEKERSDFYQKSSDLEKERSDFDQKSSDLEKERSDFYQKSSDLEKERSSLNQKVSDLNIDKVSLSASVSFLQQRKKEIEKYIDERICPHCDKVFKNEKSRNSHQWQCSANPNKNEKEPL